MIPAEPNPPQWPESVKIIHPTTENINEILQEAEDTLHSEQGFHTCGHHFSDRRLAFLFAPGEYHGIDVEVGYYSQLAGLGATRDDVRFVNCEKGPYVPALNKHLHKHGLSLDTFWRSAENFCTSAKQGMQWAVSQAAPIRNVHSTSGLTVAEGAAYASGGFASNLQVDGEIDFLGQQQWICRNSNFNGGVKGGAWSLVFVGCKNAPSHKVGSTDELGISNIPATPVRIDKPFVAMREDMTTFELRVPLLSRDSDGNEATGVDIRPFSHVFVARADDPLVNDKINTALEAGKDVVLSPGMYNLTKTIVVQNKNAVILGLGLATLVGPTDGSSCIEVKANVGGVRLAGFMVEASPSTDLANETVLVKWGEEGVKDAGDPNNPGSMFDIFCRVGGATMGDRTAYNVKSMVELHSGNIIGDNLWLWRADHAALKEGEEANCPYVSPVYYQTEQDEFITDHGLVVTGDDVTIYGLAVEHTNKDQTLWSGERGRVYFYQCELPYGVRQERFDSYCGYVVDVDVKEHTLIGGGVYSNFRNEKVVVDTAFKLPTTANVQNLFTVHLDNNGCIESILNGEGPAATEKGKPVWLSK